MMAMDFKYVFSSGNGGRRGWRGAAPHPTSQPPPGGFIPGLRNEAQPKEKAATPHY